MGRGEGVAGGEVGMRRGTVGGTGGGGGRVGYADAGEVIGRVVI